MTTWSGVWVFHEVQDGSFDEMPVSINYLQDKFGMASEWANDIDMSELRELADHLWMVEEIPMDRIQALCDELSLSTVIGSTARG